MFTKAIFFSLAAVMRRSPTFFAGGRRGSTFSLLRTSKGSARRKELFSSAPAVSPLCKVLIACADPGWLSKICLTVGGSFPVLPVLAVDRSVQVACHAGPDVIVLNAGEMESSRLSALLRRFRSDARTREIPLLVVGGDFSGSLAADGDSRFGSRRVDISDSVDPCRHVMRELRKMIGGGDTSYLAASPLYLRKQFTSLKSGGLSSQPKRSFLSETIGVSD